MVFINRPEEAMAMGTAKKIITKDKKILPIILKNYLNSLKTVTFTNIDFHYNYGGPFLNFPLSLFFLWLSHCFLFL